jgi:UrcA family protein
MYSIELSDVQGRRKHSTFNTQLAKESVMGITNVISTKAMGLAWAVLATASIALLPHAAQAGNSLDGFAQKVVSFRDLNMHSPEGIEVAYRRIKNAARDVCATPNRYDLSEAALRPCVNDAVARAVAQVNSPMLTSLYDAKTGKADKKVATLAQAH